MSTLVMFYLIGIQNILMRVSVIYYLIALTLKWLITDKCIVYYGSLYSERF